MKQELKSAETPVLAPEKAGEVKPAEMIESEVPATPTTTVAAVCVDVVDLGVVDTEWGAKPKLKFVFELGTLKANGYPATASRTFTKSLHEKSALRPALEKWLGCAMNEEELTKGFTYSKLNGRSCTLTVLAALSENGNGYNKIVAVMPAGESALKPSGTYRRWNG